MSAKTLVIVGSGNGGRIALDIARAAGFRVRGFLSSVLTSNDVINDAPVLGDDSLLDDTDFVKDNCFAVSIGTQSVRRRIAVDLFTKGADLPTLIHPTCILSEYAQVGAGSILVPGTIVNCNAVIGRFCIVNAGATIEHDTFLHDGTLVSPGVHFGGGTICGEGSFIGIGACTIAGIRIGKSATVGAGAVVIRNVADYDIVAGNPAKSIKKV